MANTTFITSQGRVFQGPGYGWFNWWRPGAAARTIVDGSNPPQLVPPVSPPVYQHTALYNDDDEFSDTTNVQRVIQSVAIPPSVAPTWNTNLWGLTEDANGNIYMNMGPIGGKAFGHRSGGITIKLGGKTNPFKPDGARAPVLHYFTSDDCSIEMELAQSDVNLMAYAVPQGQVTAGTDSLLPAGAQSYSMMTLGGLGSPRMPSPSIVVAMPKKSTASPTKCIVFTMYKACSKGEVSPVFMDSKETGYKMTFEGEAVYSRADYDQVCQWYEMT